jgi:hypothetical protein
VEQWEESEQSKRFSHGKNFYLCGKVKRGRGRMRRGAVGRRGGSRGRGRKGIYGEERVLRGAVGRNRESKGRCSEGEAVGWEESEREEG